MSDSNEILVSAYLSDSTIKTCLVPIDEKIALMTLDELKTFFGKKMAATGIIFEKGFVLFNTIDNEPFTESPFAAGDYSPLLDEVGDFCCLVVKANGLTS